MINLTLPDGQIKQYNKPVTGDFVAEDIGSGLAKAALAIKVDGLMKDLSFVIEKDCNLSIVTAKDDDALDLLRHDAAHVMAQAVQELFPETQVTIGPSIENGYYYDFAREKPFSTDDFDAIEEKMMSIVDRDLKFIREVWSRDKAIKFFNDKGEVYKAELIEAIPMNEQNYCKNTLRVSWKCFPIKNIGQMPIAHCELALVNWKVQLLQMAKFTQNTPRLMVSLQNIILEIQTLS